MTRAKAGSLPQFINDAINYNGENCLIWPFTRNNKGYAQIGKNGKKFLAHRIVCEMKNGPPPEGKTDAAHSCGNGHLGCVNPNHLRWDTRSGNLSDTIEHGTRNRGERGGRVKITEADAIKIRSSKGLASSASIAADFGISRSQASRIMNGKSWSWMMTDGGVI